MNCRSRPLPRSGLGKPPYKIKIKEGAEVLKNGSAELVQAILEEGKQGLKHSTV